MVLPYWAHTIQHYVKVLYGVTFCVVYIPCSPKWFSTNIEPENRWTFAGEEDISKVSNGAKIVSSNNGASTTEHPHGKK